MATFKVGQRARIVGPCDSKFIGLEAVYEAHEPLPGAVLQEDCLVRIPGLINYAGHDCYNAKRATLVPLTDPGADAFMERMRKLDREPVNAPVRAPETVEVPK